MLFYNDINNHKRSFWIWPAWLYVFTQNYFWKHFWIILFRATDTGKSNYNLIYKYFKNCVTLFLALPFTLGKKCLRVYFKLYFFLKRKGIFWMRDEKWITLFLQIHFQLPSNRNWISGIFPGTVGIPGASEGGWR